MPRNSGQRTPGAIFPDVTADQVCQRGYSSSVRNLPAEVSREVYREYGIAERTTGEFEVDHLEPLELAGSNDIANLISELWTLTSMSRFRVLGVFVLTRRVFTGSVESVTQPPGRL